jgi:hypothetical protein
MDTSAHSAPVNPTCRCLAFVRQQPAHLLRSVEMAGPRSWLEGRLASSTQHVPSGSRTDRYEIVAGERRWAPPKDVFGDDYPSGVIEALNDEEARPSPSSKTTTAPPLSHAESARRQTSVAAPQGRQGGAAASLGWSPNSWKRRWRSWTCTSLSSEALTQHRIQLRPCELLAAFPPTSRTRC